MTDSPNPKAAAGGNRKRRLSRRKRLLFATLVVLGLWLCGELLSLVGLWIVDGTVSFARLQRDRNRIMIRRPEGQAEEVLHPYLGWVLNPDAGVEHEIDDEGPPVNEFGFLGENDPIHQRSPKRLIVAVLGGSVARNVAVGAGDELIEELKRSPRFHDRKIELIPLALGAYKQPQQLFVLNYFLALGAEFDVVVNIDGVNEVTHHPAENALDNVFLAYPRSWFARAQDIPDPRIAPLVYRITTLKQTRKQWASRFSNPPLSVWPSANFLWRTRDNLLAGAISRDRLAIDGHRHRTALHRGYVQTGPDVPSGSEEEMLDRLTLLWSRCSQLLAQVCRANGTQYHHVLQPNQYIVGSKPMNQSEREVAILADHPYRHWIQAGYPRLRKAGQNLREQGVRFHDETYLFQHTRKLIYVDNCCHYNHAGNVMLARAVARHIVDEYQPAAQHGDLSAKAASP